MEKKIRLDTISDLQRLSFLEIKNLPLNRCQGDLFESALKQAIQLEKQHAVDVNNNSGGEKGNLYAKFINKHHYKAFEIKYVVFQIQYEVDFGTEMSIVGSIPILGKWNTMNSLNLHWNNGHVWRSEPIPLETLLDTNNPKQTQLSEQNDHFEYKFVITDEEGNARQWQNGMNMIFDLKKLQLTLKELNVPSSIDNHKGETPFFTIDRRTKIKLESSNNKLKQGDILVIISKFD
eukprot:403374583